MAAPSETTATKNTRNELSGETEAGGKATIPLVAEGEGKVKVGVTRSWGTETSKTFRQGGLPPVIKEIGGSDFVVFIDDFHYIRPELRDEVGKQLKVAAENGVRIVTASVG